MEPITQQLLNLGVGGLMAAAVFWFLVNLMTKVIPGLSETFRQDVERERQLCREALQAIQSGNEKMWHALQENQKSTTELTNVVKSLVEEVKQLKGKT